MPFNHFVKQVPVHIWTQTSPF